MYETKGDNNNNGPDLEPVLAERMLLGNMQILQFLMQGMH